MTGIGRRLLICVALAGVAIVVPVGERHLRAARVLLHLMQPGPSAAGETQSLVLRVGDDTVRARLYLPRARIEHPPALILLHGAHPRGIDEARLIAFASSLAEAGIEVLTPELPELMAYRIESHTTERIASLAHLYAQRAGVPAVGVMGISFAGGLALIAAAKARDAESIAFVVCVGAHHDLARLTRYYAGAAVRGPGGEPSHVTPHPYGARVLLREHLERFFSAGDLPQAQRALDSYLHDEHAAAQQQALALSPAGRDTMRVLLDSSGSAALSQMLLSAADAVRPELARASPRSQLARLDVPVFLVHGADDPIIPSIETLWLAHELPRSVRREVVISPLLRHAEIARAPTLRETWTLVHFMADVLAASEAERFRRPRTDHAR